MDKQKLYWIGIQESEINDTDNLFEGSCTIFGSQNGKNIAYDNTHKIRFDYDKENEDWYKFVNSYVHKIISDDPDTKFLMYYPMDLNSYSEELQNRVIAANDLRLLETLDNKLLCRRWLGNKIPMLSQQICYGEKMLNDGARIFSERRKFVIQSEYSSGGSGTWLYEENTYSEVLSRIEADKIYSVSPYIEKNISLNIHIVIYAEEVILLPPSIQLIKINNCSFKYCGADFIAYKFLPEIIKSKVKNYALTIGERLRKSGYLGICGVDLIATADEVYFMEINPRFQSSGFLINKALKKSGQSFSLQKLHIDAFKNRRCQYSTKDLTVEYSYYKYFFDRTDCDFLKYFNNVARNSEECEYLDDGLSDDMQFEVNTYLFKLVFNKNISYARPDFSLIIHSNVQYADTMFNHKEITSDLHILKTLLLLHGVSADNDTIEMINYGGGINYEEFYAVDMIIFDKIYINVPFKYNLATISPFNIRVENNSVTLYYYFNKLFDIKLREQDPLSNRITSLGNKYSRISYKGNDRLRIYHRMGCYYKDKNVGCKFCDMDDELMQPSFNEIKEILQDYGTATDVNHFLIGGGSQSPDSNFEFICSIANYIKNEYGKPIYLMSLPPQNEEILKSLKSSGITEVAFNVEIYDRTIAEQYMPGKGKIDLETYVKALSYSVKLWGRTGNVRTIFIVGLEPEESLLKGVELFCKIGVSPILSLFKPIEGTPLSYILPPTAGEILSIWNKVEDICKKWNVPLGPSCRFCEDNVLKITY